MFLLDLFDIQKMVQMKWVVWALNRPVVRVTSLNAATALASPFNGNAIWNKVITILHFAFSIFIL